MYTYSLFLREHGPRVHFFCIQKSDLQNWMEKVLSRFVVVNEGEFKLGHMLRRHRISGYIKYDEWVCACIRHINQPGYAPCACAGKIPRGRICL